MGKKASNEAPGRQVLVGKVLLVLASILGLYLGWVSLTTSAVAGCGEGSSCDTVLASKYSKLFGLPIGLLGVSLYLVVIAGAGRAGGRLRMLALASMVAIPLSAAWFGFVQAFLLKAFCPWCCATHALAVAGVVLIALSMRKRGGAAGLMRFAVPAGVASVAGMVAVQSMAAEPETVLTATLDSAAVAEAPPVDPDAPRMLSLHDGKISFDVKDLPMLGEPDAQHLIAVVADYACGHCRNLHRMLDDVQERYGDESLGVVLLPGMRNGDSQKIHEIMLPLWKYKPESFAKLDAKLLSGKLVQKPEIVRAAALEEFGGVEEELAAFMAEHRQWAISKLQIAASVFNANAKITGRKVYAPSWSSAPR